MKIHEIEVCTEDGDPTVALVYGEDKNVFEPAYIDLDTQEISFAIFSPNQYKGDKVDPTYMDELECFIEELALMRFLLSFLNAYPLEYFEGNTWEFRVEGIKLEDIQRYIRDTHS